MKKLLLITASICACTGVSAESMLNSFLKKISNPGVDQQYSGIGKIRFGNYYMYSLNKKADTSKTKTIESDIKQIENKHLGNKSSDGYDPVAIKAALDWQASDDPNKHANPWETKDVMVDVESKETELLYGDDSPLRDDAVTQAWERARLAEQKLKAHREYMKSITNSKKSIANIKENDPKTNQTSSTD